MPSLQLAVAWYLVGLIAVVQVVVYPLFRFVSATDWPRYHAYHVRFITPVVAPAMILQLGLCLLQVWQRGAASDWYGLVLEAIAWISTFVWAVPLHQRLQQAHDPRLVRQLTWANVPRAVAWAAHALVLTLGN